MRAELQPVPGRKTDVKDAERIAQLMRHGLLKRSFIPDEGQRELRDLTRHRTRLLGERAAAANRLHKILEDANLILTSVASDIQGVSARAMLDALIAGETRSDRAGGSGQRQAAAQDPRTGGGADRSRAPAPSLHVAGDASRTWTS